jgi:hypothetical protein
MDVTSYVIVIFPACSKFCSEDIPFPRVLDFKKHMKQRERM